MKPSYKPNFKNRPPHIIKQNGYYFITSRTLNAQWVLQPDKYKQILLDIIKNKTKKFSFSLVAYVILNNHYHIIVDAKKADDLSKFMNEINGASSRLINDADGVVGRKIWWNYFESLLATEAAFYTHLNYLHQNPIKHGLTKDFSYKFSSYNGWVKKKGREYLDDSYRKYSVIDFKILNDEI